MPNTHKGRINAERFPKGVLPSRIRPIWQNLGHFAQDGFRKLLQASDLQDRPSAKGRKFCHEKHFLFDVAKVQKTDE